MFTGIIQALGTVERVQARGKARFITIKTNPKIARRAPEGGSVSVDGVCLTSLRRARGTLTFELLDSTLKRTTLGAWKVGDRVNVEPAMLAGQPIGGHFISGHVDGVGVVRKVSTRWHTRYVVIGVPRALTRYLVPQGSVVVNGVALTIVEVGPPLNLPLVKGEKEGVGSFSVALTSYTQKHTNLGEVRVGDKVNVEVDILAKYVERIISSLRER
ncbi:riboflavin synthase [Candidatus Uhrbacteria bacterium]|nr:riboflavin synthase [Candidatus Uhrbacteria bacterium]